MLLQLKKELFRYFYSKFVVASNTAIVALVYNKLVAVQL